MHGHFIINQDLLAEAMELGDHKVPEEAVQAALKEYIRHLKANVAPMLRGGGPWGEGQERPGIRPRT